ncbi:MAG: hypothetical protein QNJ98_17890 [Planctomycetota bacterium]|nr:hypothetical protein [Planctomycetota bacterium]
MYDRRGQPSFGQRYYGGRHGHLPSHRYIGELGQHLVYRVHRRPAPMSLQLLGWPGLTPAPDPTKQPKLDNPAWDDEILALVNATWRRPLVLEGEGAFHFTFAASNLHPTRGTARDMQRRELWVRNDAWYSQSGTLSHQPFDAWVYGGKRGSLAAAFRLARTRDAKPSDATDWGFAFQSLGRYAPAIGWRSMTARIVSREGDLVTVALKAPGVHENETWLVIDSKRSLLVERRQLRAGKVVGRMTWSKPIEAGGAWWPTVVEQHDDKERLVYRATLGVKAIERAELDAVVKREQAAQADVVTVDGPLPTVDEAKQARHDRKAAFKDEVVLSLHFASTQQWDETWTHWDAAKRFVADKPGANFAQSVLMQRSRRGEAFKTFLAELATYIDGVADVRRATFLAPHLLGLASGVLGYNEQLALLERYENAWIAPKAPLAELRRKRWLEYRAQYLWNVGRQEDARAVRRTLAESFPHDVRTQTTYENDLWATGRRVEALDYLGDVLSQREPWLPSEREQLYVHWTNRLWQARDLDRLQAALTVWLTHEARSATPQMRFNSMLYLRGQTEAGDTLVTDTLAERLDDGAEQAAWYRLDAAVRMALGYGWHFQIRRVEPMWVEPLRDLALHYARADLKHGTPANQVMGDWRFRRTQGWRDVRAGLRADLAADTTLESFSLRRLGFYLQHLPWDRRNVDADFWRSVVDALRARYEAATDANDKNVLAGHVLRLLDAHDEKDEALDFLRARMAAAEDKVKHTFAQQIWERLLQRDYAPERENELFQLLSKIGGPELSDEQRRSFFASQIRRLADRIYTWRQEDHLGPPASRKDLTRAALKALQAEAKQKARAAVVSRLKAAALDAPAVAREWMQIERLGYAVQLGEMLDSVAAEATGLLTKTWATDGDPLDRLIRERAAVILAYACSRRGAPDERIEDALALFALGAKAQDELLEKDDEAIQLLDWRYQTFRLLVALDRADPLEKTLASWIVPSRVESRWRIALAYVQAELGKLQPAVRQLEAVEAADELGMDEYRVLADWYLVLDEDAKHDAAKLGIYKKMNEWSLADLLSRYQRRASRRNGVPEDLDPEALRIMRVLMRKSQWPANHVWRIRNFYRSVKDFRLLESMVDGLTGHTKEGIYGFLQQFQSIAREIHEEATCDAIVKRIDEISKDASLTPLDRRALQLLTGLIEQRASQVPETDPTHEARALAALKQAQQGEWQSGERRLMAGFLSALRFPADGAFHKEQMRQLRSLFDAEPATSSDRLWIGQSFAQAWWAYKRYDQAIDTLAEAIQSERARTKGVLASNADNAFNTLISWLGTRKRFRDAETRLLAEMRRRKLPSRVEMLENKLFQLYGQALYHGGSTSLGRGKTLFDAASAKILTILDREVIRANPLLNTYGYLHVAANHSRALTDAGARLRTWSKEEAPRYLARLPLQAHSHAGSLAGNLRSLLGPNGGLEALLDHHDRQSAWITRIGYDIWSQQTYNLARWRAESNQPLGGLEPRLWALVERAAEKKLITGDNRGSYFWNPRHKWYWGAKRTAFAAVATRVLELHETKPAILKRVAQFQRALGYGREAIATMMRALERETADVGMRWTLVSWLHQDSRNKEALPLVSALVTEHPATLRYWRMKIDVQGALGQKDALALTLKEAEAWYRENDRWRESVAAGLGEEAVQHGQHKEGVRLYQEAIELRIAARGYKGGRDTRLARYYRILADGLGGLDRTDEAIRAVSAALVAGSRSQNERNKTIQVLQRILDQSKDLDAWSNAYEAEVEKTGLDATPLRKALAKAYEKRGKHERTLHHLLAARDVDPRDAAIHQGLVAAYDRLADAKGAINALFGSIRLAPQNIAAYEQLAERYRKAGDGAEAERALTTLVEITPHDAAGHQRLAEIRVEQKRLPEAAVQWRQVIRTRTLEPTGYLGLVRVLISLDEREEARKTIDHLMQSQWEERFGDVRAQAARLLQQLDG